MQGGFGGSPGLALLFGAAHGLKERETRKIEMQRRTLLNDQIQQNMESSKRRLELMEEQEEARRAEAAERNAIYQTQVEGQIAHQEGIRDNQARDDAYRAVTDARQQAANALVGQSISEFSQGRYSPEEATILAGSGLPANILSAMLLGSEDTLSESEQLELESLRDTVGLQLATSRFYESEEGRRLFEAIRGDNQAEIEDATTDALNVSGDPRIVQHMIEGYEREKRDEGPTRAQEALAISDGTLEARRLRERMGNVDAAQRYVARQITQLRTIPDIDPLLIRKWVAAQAELDVIRQTEFDQGIEPSIDRRR